MRHLPKAGIVALGTPGIYVFFPRVYARSSSSTSIGSNGERQVSRVNGKEEEHIYEHTTYEDNYIYTESEHIYEYIAHEDNFKYIAEETRSGTGKRHSDTRTVSSTLQGAWRHRQSYQRYHYQEHCRMQGIRCHRKRKQLWPSTW